MKAKPKNQNQDNLFKSRLDQILKNKHPMFVLANQIDWDFFEKEFGEYYCEDNGRPGLPIRLMVGIHYLKCAYDSSDESLIYTYLGNPYWQYFLGFVFFQHNFAIGPTSLVKWCHRIGSEAMEMLLHEDLETAQRMKYL